MLQYIHGKIKICMTAATKMTLLASHMFNYGSKAWLSMLRSGKHGYHLGEFMEWIKHSWDQILSWKLFDRNSLRCRADDDLRNCLNCFGWCASLRELLFKDKIINSSTRSQVTPVRTYNNRIIHWYYTFRKLSSYLIYAKTIKLWIRVACIIKLNVLISVIYLHAIWLNLCPSIETQQQEWS